MRTLMQIGIIFLLSHGFTQDFNNIFLEDMISSYSEISDLEPNEEEVMVYENQDKKININRLNPAELSKIPFLSMLSLIHI